jgi:hypothetical protein
MTATLPDQKPAQALPLERLKVRLRLRERTRFHFQHGGVLHGLLCKVFGSHLPPGLFPLALESGRVDYAPGDLYDFVVTAAGPSRALLRGIGPSLRSLAQEKRGPSTATLDGNFDVEAVEQLPLPTLEEALGRAEFLALRQPLRLICHSPLRLRRSPELALPGAGYLNQECFPVDLLLDRLWRRYRQLLDGDFPETASIPAPPPAASARVEHLIWFDMPVRGKLDGKPGRPGGTTLGGVCGAVSLAELPPTWVRLLALMEGGQLGSSTHFGFGAFALEALPVWCRPACTFEDQLGEQAGDPRAVAAALLPSALAILDEGAAHFRRGLSRFSAEEGERRARGEGYRHELAGEVARRVEALSAELVLPRLAALWPSEPAVVRLAGWLASPVARPALGELLSALFASDLAEDLARDDLRLVRTRAGLQALARLAR